MTEFEAFMKSRGYKGEGMTWFSSRLGIPIGEKKMEELKHLFEKTLNKNGRHK